MRLPRALAASSGLIRLAASRLGVTLRRGVRWDWLGGYGPARTARGATIIGRPVTSPGVGGLSGNGALRHPLCCVRDAAMRPHLSGRMERPPFAVLRPVTGASTVARHRTAALEGAGAGVHRFLAERLRRVLID